MGRPLSVRGVLATEMVDQQALTMEAQDLVRELYIVLSQLRGQQRLFTGRIEGLSQQAHGNKGGT